MNNKEKNKFEKNIKRINKLSIVLIVIYALMSLIAIIKTTTYSLEISKSSINEIKQNESIIEYVSTINSYTYSEIIEINSNIEDKYEYMVLELIIPTIISLTAYIFVIVTLKEIYNLTTKINDKEKLYTEENYNLLKKVIRRTKIGLFFLMRNLISWLFICLLLDAISYLFNSSVELKKMTKKL